MKKLSLLVFLFLAANILAQEENKNSYVYTNSADQLLAKDGKLMIGGYGEIHYNQALNADTKNNGVLDVHRMVMLLGYNFNSKTQFITELEFEHVKEVYVEQAFLQYRLNSSISFRGGLLLVPMGLINEYHEPTAYHGVERPTIDKYISPSTWREIGFGITGNILPASMKYQAYVMNGFNGYDGSGTLNGTNGLRKGRQKGADSYISAPNFTAKVEYYGLSGLNLGLSGYFGPSQSTLYDGLSKDDDVAMATADSSSIGIAMLGLDARYQHKGLQLKGQFYYTSLSNTNPYNDFTGNDLGSAMMGYYAEIAYDVFHSLNVGQQLYPFVRYEYMDTHQSVENRTVKNESYNKNIITTGLTLGLAKGVVVKTDMQFVKSGSANAYTKAFNAGIGIMF
jgi:hypothetical protein